MKVLYFLRDNGGCGWYRCVSPIETAAQANLISVQHVEKGDHPDAIAEKLAWSEVVVCPRVFDAAFCAAVKAFKELGKKVVIDWDDNVFDISPLSPHYKDFGTKNYAHEYFDKDGTKQLDIWTDGRNIDLAKNSAGLERARVAMREADLVTTTTEILASKLRPFNSNVKVLPNCVDFDLWKKLPLQAHPGIRFGWTGGYSHFEDWKILAGVLPEFMRLNPTATLVLLGQKFEGTLKGIDPKRIEYRGWCPTPSYPYVSAIMDLDFAVIPLVDSNFNNCKSAIKWLEMAALQVPAVTSFCSPYSEMMDLEPENGIFIEGNEPSGWLIGLNRMARNVQERLLMGRRARKTVEKFYDIEKNAYKWVEAFKEVLNGIAV